MMIMGISSENMKGTGFLLSPPSWKCSNTGRVTPENKHGKEID